MPRMKLPEGNVPGLIIPALKQGVWKVTAYDHSVNGAMTLKALVYAELRDAFGDNAGNPQPGKRRIGQFFLPGSAVFALPAVTYVMTRGRAGVARAPKITSLAVLPLKNLSGDPTQEYLADGMTEALISRLSRSATCGLSRGHQ